MKFKSDESAIKLRGGYYTDPHIASFLLRWVLQSQPKRILEPSCGDGVFVRSLAGFGPTAVERVTGFEIEAGEAAKARQAGKMLPAVAVEILSQDFLSWSGQRLSSPPPFDAVVGNPPFIRYQYLDKPLQARAQALFKHFQLPFTRHTNAWVPFVIASLALLRPGGRLGMVLPAELLHVLHAQSLRDFLRRTCSRLLIFDPAELWFAETLQGAVLLLAEKKNGLMADFQGVGIISTRSKSFLDDDPDQYFRQADYANGATIAGKWMPALLSHEERAILQKTRSNRNVHRFGALAEVAVGIVTGANKFFLVPDRVVEDYDLQPWAHPMFGRSDHVPGLIYDEAVHQANREKGLPTNFLWFGDESLSELPERVQAYLKRGEQTAIHKRYKCRIRRPWYGVPSVYATPIGMLKRCHDLPRLIYNKLEAFTTDTAYRVRPIDVSPRSLVFSFVNSLTALLAELEGRHYGGGVLELVPSEIRKLQIPVYPASERAVYELDAALRSGLPAPEILARQDARILEPIGVSRNECLVLQRAWQRLRNRRQRR